MEKIAKTTAESIWLDNNLEQGFRVTCLWTGQYNTKGYGKITDVI